MACQRHCRVHALRHDVGEPRRNVRGPSCTPPNSVNVARPSWGAMHTHSPFNNGLVHPHNAAVTRNATAAIMGDPAKHFLPKILVTCPPPHPPFSASHPSPVGYSAVLPLHSERKCQSPAPQPVPPPPQCPQRRHAPQLPLVRLGVEDGGGTAVSGACGCVCRSCQGLPVPDIHATEGCAV